MNRILSLRSIVATLSFLIPFSSHASDALDEIVVTADFRERSVTELPHSVTVMDAEFIEEAAVQHFEELVNLVPNLNWSGDGHRARYFQIRGVGELEQYQGAPNPSIGFLIDDIDFSGIGTVATLFDIESVEILRGSQGSRYGANALGGLVYMRSALPDGERNGRVELTAAGDSTRSLGAAFGGVLVNDAATYRLSAQKYQSDGFRNNSFLNRDDTNGRDETAVRARVRYEVSDTLLANLAAMYSNIDNGYDAFALDNGYTVLSDKPGEDAQESIGASIRLDWAVAEHMTATSITALADSDIEYGFDADWGNDVSWSPFIYDFVSDRERSRKTISQEFRLSTEAFTVGAYALNLVEDLRNLDVGIYDDPSDTFSAAVLFYPFDSDYEANSMALFVAADQEVGEAARFSAGLRAEYREADYRDSDGLSIKRSDKMWGGELSGHRDIGNGTNAYVTLSKGFKAGGFNLGLVPNGNREFEDEQLWSLETGIKSSLLDHSILINASLFHSRRIDQQVRTSVQLDPNDPASFVFFTANAGDGETTGLEVDIRWFPADNWEWYANIGVLDATLDTGREQAHAPRYTFAGGVAYRHSNGFFARVDVNGKDDFFFDVNHDQKSQSYELTNARIGFEGANWLVSLWARNLFDKHYAVRGFYFGNEPPAFPATLYTRLGDPRQVGVTIERSF